MRVYYYRMKLYRHGYRKVKYLVTGNKPFYLAEVFINNEAMSWKKRNYTKGKIIIVMDSSTKFNKLLGFLVDHSYLYIVLTVKHNQEGKCDPNDMDILNTSYGSEVEITLTPKQTVKGFLKDLHEFNRENEVKLVYLHKKIHYIVA